jgi:hypothetical protein
MIGKGIISGKNIELLDPVNNLPNGSVVKLEISPVHPLMHLSDLECQQKILGAIGDWKDDREIDEIFTLIDRQRHAASERQIFSVDD